MQITPSLLIFLLTIIPKSLSSLPLPILVEPPTNQVMKTHFIKTHFFASFDTPDKNKQLRATSDSATQE